MSEFSINLPPRLPNAGPAPNILTAIVPDPPRQLAQLDNGTIIKGLVQGRDPDGLLVVATDKGALKLSTAANIPPGTLVTLEVRSAGDRLQVLVLAVEGQSGGGTSGPRTGTAPPPATSSGGQTPAPPPSTVTAPRPAPVAIVGSVLQGTIVQAAPDTLSQLIRSLLPSPPVLALPSPLTTAGQPAQPTGSAPGNQTNPLPKALVSALQSDVRAKIEALFFSASPARAALDGTLLAGVQAVGQAFKPPIALTTGSEVRLRLIAVASAPGQPLVIPAAASAAQHVIAGRIIGYTPSGNAVLSSQLGAVILQGALSVPVGTELSAAVEHYSLPTASPPPFSSQPSPQMLLSVARSWPSLAEAIGLLRQNATSADALPALARLPQAGPKLAAGLLAAIHAIQATDAEALLGALVAARSGNAARDEIARKLRQEFAQVASLAQERPGIDWRCCFIPILDDGTVRQINLFYRRDRRKERKDAKDEKSGTRFIVEVDMSQMGPFQFDGLVREKQFDLMVRSRLALPPRFREDITTLFHEALALGDYRGGLVFQWVNAFPVSPLEEIERSATSVSA
jgi:hypothetical protein